jgi:hypothetical protein
MRHALSRRGYDQFFRMASWFFRNRVNTSDHFRSEFLVTFLSQRERTSA